MNVIINLAHTAKNRMQIALDTLSEWASDWGAQINLSKTVTTIFSLSNHQEKVNLKINEVS